MGITRPKSEEEYEAYIKRIFYKGILYGELDSVLKDLRNIKGEDEHTKDIRRKNLTRMLILAVCIEKL